MTTIQAPTAPAASHTLSLSAELASALGALQAHVEALAAGAVGGAQPEAADIVQALLWNTVGLSVNVPVPDGEPMQRLGHLAYVSAGLHARAGYSRRALPLEPEAAALWETIPPAGALQLLAAWSTAHV